MKKLILIAPASSPEKGAVVERVRAYLKYMKKYKVKILNLKKESLFSFYLKLIKNRPEIIIVTTPPFKTLLLSFPIFLINKLLRLKIKIILDVRDLPVIGKFKEFKKGLLLFAHILTNATFIVTKEVGNFFPIKGRVHLIPNGADTEIFYPKKRKRKNLATLKLVYSGILHTTGLKEVLSNLDDEFLKKQKINLYLALLVNFKNNKDKEALRELKKLVKKRKIQSRIKFYYNLKKKNLKDFLSKMEGGLVPLPLENKYKYRIPVKTYEYLACGIPLIGIGPKGGELEKLIKRYKIGLFSPNYKNLAPTIKEFKATRRRLKKNVFNILWKIDRKKIVEKAEKIIEKMLEEN